MHFIQVICLMLFLVLSPHSFAVNYYWSESSVNNGAKFSSPSDLCLVWRSKFSEIYGEIITEVVSSSMARCSLQYHNDNLTFWRNGDSCPTDKPIYNPATGECESEPVDCSASTGQTLLARSSGPITIVNGRSYVISSPPSVCSAGCSFNPNSSGATSCYADSGSTTSGFCNYVVVGSGESCTVDNLVPGGTGDPLPSGDTPDPEAPPSDPNDPGCPSGYSWSGTTCVQSDGSGGTGDGTGSGGTGDGTGGTGDGTGSGGTGDGSGGTGDGTGSGGSGDGTGDGSGDGTGSGGGGTGGGDSDEEGQDLPSGTLEEPERGSFAEAIAEWDQKIADSRVELKAKHAQLAQLVAAQTAFDLSSSSGRLYCESAEFYGRIVEICLDDYSDELSVIRYVLIFLATMLAFYIIFVRD